MRTPHETPAEAAFTLTADSLLPALRHLARSRAARRAVLAAAVLALAIIWVRLALRPSTDLLNHREFGRRFIAGTFLYEGGLDYPYLPAWAAAHAPLALVPVNLASPLMLPLGVAALLGLARLLRSLSRGALALEPAAEWWVAAGAIALASRFVIRDLLDGGENLVLTALAWAGLVAWLQQRRWLAAWLLGAAIALKLTAAIFLVALVVRRRYSFAARAALCAVVLAVLPAIVMGIESYSAHVERWGQGVQRGIASADPSVGVLGPEPLGNLGLRAAIGRLAVSPESTSSQRAMAARGAAVAAAAMAVVVFALLYRHRSADGLGDAVVWAAAGVLGLLISPITWRAHLVATLPAVYLLLRRWTAEGRLYAGGRIGLAALAVPGVLLARGVVGERISDWSDAWSLTTAALVCLTLGTARWPTRP